MAMIKTQLKKWGNSFGIIIPKEIIAERKLHEHDEIAVLIMQENTALKETFGLLKGQRKQSSQHIKDTLREELYDDD